MCIRAVDIVLAAHLQPPTLKLTAVAMAHMLNSKTRLLNPSIATIASRVGVSVGQGKRCVRQLKDLGLISVVANAHGGKPGTTPHYFMHLERFDAIRQTECTDAPPTGSAGDTPALFETGGADAQEGVHGSPRGGAPMHETGGAHAPLTGRNRKEPEENRVAVQADAFPDAAPADAGPRPPDVVGVPAKRLKKEKAPSKTEATWAAYSEVYTARHGAAPLRNGKENTLMARVVQQLGADDAPAVARFYVNHPSDYYAGRMHSLSCLLADAASLHTQWKTGRHAQQAATRAKRAPSHSGFETKNYRAGVTEDGRIV